MDYTRHTLPHTSNFATVVLILFILIGFYSLVTLLLLKKVAVNLKQDILGAKKN